MNSFILGSPSVEIGLFWSDFLSLCKRKCLQIQYLETRGYYQIFASDHDYLYTCRIFTGVVSPSIVSQYPQTKNDLDKIEFETLYMDTANERCSPKTDTRNGSVQSRIVTNTGTYGRTTFECDDFSVPPDSTIKRNYKWPYAVDLVDGRIVGGVKTGDKARFVVAPNTPLHAMVGYQPLLAQPISTGDKVIHFNPSFLKTFVDSAIIDSGNFELYFAEGGATSGPYRVSYYKKRTGEVTLGMTKFWTGDTEPPDWAGFDNAFSTSVEIYATRIFLDNMIMEEGVSMEFGSRALGSAPLPADVHLQLQYDTTSEIGDRNIKVVFHKMTGKIENAEEDDD